MGVSLVGKVMSSALDMLGFMCLWNDMQQEEEYNGRQPTELG